VTDSGGNVGGSGCGTVTINAVPSSGQVKLLIGKSANALPPPTPAYFGSGYDLIQIKRGDPFVLNWNVSLPIGAGEYTCTPAVSEPGIHSGDWPSWTSTSITGNGTKSFSNTNTIPTGKHQFLLSCLNGAGDYQPSSVILDVKSSSIREL
jgi:hypothetical protein